MNDNKLTAKLFKYSKLQILKFNKWKNAQQHNDQYNSTHSSLCFTIINNPLVKDTGIQFKYIGWIINSKEYFQNTMFQYLYTNILSKLMTKIMKPNNNHCQTKTDYNNCIML